MVLPPELERTACILEKQVTKCGARICLEEFPGVCDPWEAQDWMSAKDELHGVRPHLQPEAGRAALLLLHFHLSCQTHLSICLFTWPVLVEARECQHYAGCGTVKTSSVLSCTILNA